MLIHPASHAGICQKVPVILSVRQHKPPCGVRVLHIYFAAGRFVSLPHTTISVFVCSPWRLPFSYCHTPQSQNMCVCVCVCTPMAPAPVSQQRDLPRCVENADKVKAEVGAFKTLVPLVQVGASAEHTQMSAMSAGLHRCLPECAHQKPGVLNVCWSA